MRIVVCCSGRRGYSFLQRLRELCPQNDFIVFSFREEPWEPPFLDDIIAFTRSCGGEFHEGKNLGAQGLNRFWESRVTDLMFLVGWRYMLPPSVYRRPSLGTFVFHDSLLPRYRGFSPTVWAIINGEDHSGVTLFEIAEGVDAGDIVDQQRIPISQDDTISTVIERCTQSYLDMLERNLDKLLEGSAPRYVQDHSLATYTCKRLPNDNQIDWSLSSERIYNLIRAVSAPYPGAYTYLAGQKIFVWEARRVAGNTRSYVGRIPGRVVEVRPNEGSIVLTGDSSLFLTKVQIEGDKPTCASQVLKSVSLTLGS